MPILRKHVSIVHENACSRICDICGKTFKTAGTYNLHYETTHSRDPLEKVQCAVCGKW